MRCPSASPAEGGKYVPLPQKKLPNTVPHTGILYLGINAKSRYFFELRPGFHSDLETCPDSRTYYCPAPKIDHFSESYPDSRTSSQHVSEWHHLRNHVSESTYEKIHARNPNIMRNTNPRSLGFKKHYPKSLQRFCIYPESKHSEEH